jgi:hypothetical protein
MRLVLLVEAKIVFVFLCGNEWRCYKLRMWRMEIFWKYLKGCDFSVFWLVGDDTFYPHSFPSQSFPILSSLIFLLQLHHDPSLSKNLMYTQKNKLLEFWFKLAQPIKFACKKSIPSIYKYIFKSFLN